MFRIDRRNVKISGKIYNKFNADDNPEVVAEAELPDATASAEALANEYLSAAEAEINAKSEEILANARDRAAEIIVVAREEAEELQKKSWQEGFELGTAEGRRTFEEKTAEKIRQDDEALKRVLEEIYNERESTYKELEAETINLALEIVRKIINPAEDELGNVYTSLIKNALRQTSTESKIVLRVGATEYERFFSSGAAEIELDSGVTVKTAVLKDASLSDGDLIIDTDDITINAGIDSQLYYVELAFERANQYEPDVRS